MEFLKTAITFFCLFYPAIGHSSHEMFPECGSPACSKVAQHSEYTRPSVEKYIVIDIVGYKVKIPPRPSKMYLTNGILYITYKNESVLVLGAGPVPENIHPNESSISGTQLPEITFLRTASDKEPTEIADKYVWRFAIDQKKYYFEEARNVSYTDFGGISYFVSDSKFQDFTGRAFVTSKKRKHNYLQIDAKKLDFSEFKRIVLSVE